LTQALFIEVHFATGTSSQQCQHFWANQLKSTTQTRANDVFTTQQLKHGDQNLSTADNRVIIDWFF